ncbi:hypothetical protein [Nocardia sp. NPDC050406]|uniref:hypothetical protein n=1 Tax=Nocardia sp. NPDC050406 TaxID=3364318 RepID=UPI0037897869
MLKTIVAAAVFGAALFSGAGVASAAPVVQCQAIGCEPQGGYEDDTLSQDVAPGVDDRPNGTDGNCGKYACQWK